ncbi:MAG: vitamin K epoxide reductase family protein [Chloroflexi bacterium]|nr:vitamin K epoxide reductase family protein [Chloroflexota bacterium]
MLIVGETILLGSLDILEQFPGEIERHLARGGTGWPDIPGLAEALAEAQAQPTPVANQTTAAPIQTVTHSSGIISDDPPTSLSDRLARDPTGNALAIFVLVGMLVSVGGFAAFLLSPTKKGSNIAIPVAVPILCLIGMAVAGYLAYVETSQIRAVCGPVGDCNSVQQSEYARLFGVLPIGVLGLSGYVAILAVWLLGHFGPNNQAYLASLALLGMAFVGVIFSIYLTFLEPFVIGATCTWCLSSAIIMTGLLWLSAKPGKQALALLYRRDINVTKRQKMRLKGES